MKGKSEPATNRIKMVLEAFSSYIFSLYYLKGKDMVLRDFQSMMEGDNSDPHEVIPISFNSHSNFTGYYYTFFTLLPEAYRVATMSQTRAVGDTYAKGAWSR